jgi:phenylacetate-CoA ligase
MISPVETWIAERTGLQEKLTPETLRNWQKEKLRNLIYYASKNSRFYADRLGSSADLSELPFTLPEDIVKDPLAFLAIPQSQVARVTTLANSGTTHLRKRIFFSASDLEKTVDFFSAGMSTMLCKGDHVQILISNRTENSLGSLLSESLSGIGVSSEIHGAIKTAGIAVEAARNADCLVGMPAEVLYMSRIEPGLRPKSVLLAADYIPQTIIDSISETWKCSVFSHYGHTEFGYGCAVDCGQHNGLHTRDADHIFEIIDPETLKPAKPGESGEIVITTLSNEAMPLIRYRTGNISRFTQNRCRCGSVLPRLDRIEGRISDNIYIDDKTVSIHRLDEIVFSDKAVRGFNAQIISEGKRNTLHLTVDSTDKIDFTSLAAELPSGLNIKVTYDKADPFSHREKRRIHIWKTKNI